jgi:uncharacterized protein
MMLRDELHKQKDLIETLAFQHGAKRIRLFGSVALGLDCETSDIDFLVDLPVGYDLFEQRLALVESLNVLTGRRVDLVLEHELNPHISVSILSGAVEL